ncbi:MAG TPA: 3-hydroxyacyl-CoA dehydrogenase NAD-binding domain-containing protein [Chloroflexota bacterium]|nr:3-hydroxyacyl-CoA dehydrogenase NAD-binding domain-containing protein [Chloroflexota bacterium]
MAVDVETPGTIRTEIEDGIATLWLDRAGEPVNLIDLDFIAHLENAVTSLPPDLRGLIVASAKPEQFLAGADLRQLLQARSPEEASEATRLLQDVIKRIRALPYPTVAAINGPALGGGLEIALACDYRVCVESDSQFLGLPEVQLGLLPAGGGTQHLPRLIGLSRALGLILQGRRYTPRRGARYGVVDDVVHPAILLPAAQSWLARGKRTSTPRWSRLDQFADRFGPVRRLIYLRAGGEVQRETRGNYPAPIAALKAVRIGQEQGYEAGLAAESASFGELATGPVARNLIHLFFAQEALKAEQRPLAKQAVTVERIAVVGAGFMGAGIAQAAAAAGFGVRLRDMAPEKVAKALAEARRLTRHAARRGRFSRSETRAIESRLSGTTDDSGLAHTHFAIEAVFEDPNVKRDVIANLESRLPENAVIASNTSSLPISSLATDAKRPERIVGMHFFSPVHRMPLLEVVRPDSASDEAIATTVTVGRKLGKTVIVVSDGPGFYTTRVLGAMLQEAGRMFAEGASIAWIDAATTVIGFPVGSMALMDEVGLDVAAHVGSILHDAFPDRFPPNMLIQTMIDAGRLGRKTGKGFYDYSGKHKKPDPDVDRFHNSSGITDVSRRDCSSVSVRPGRRPDIQTDLPGGAGVRNTPLRVFLDRMASSLDGRRAHGESRPLPTSSPLDSIRDRLLLAFVNEAVRCLDEGIIANPRNGDVGAVFGIGFPPFLGGPFRWIDDQGAASVVTRLQTLEASHGPLFTPATSLVRNAESGTRYYPEA